MIFWTKPPAGGRFRICFAVDISLGRGQLVMTPGARAHVHFSCIWIDGELTQEEGREFFWRPPA